jgi:hypothetical protein
LRTGLRQTADQFRSFGRLLRWPVVDDGRAGLVQGADKSLVALEHFLDEGAVLPVNLENVLDEFLRHLEKKISFRISFTKYVTLPGLKKQIVFFVFLFVI